MFVRKSEANHKKWLVYNKTKKKQTVFFTVIYILIKGRVLRSVC